MSNADKDINKKLAKADPIKRDVEKGMEPGEENSPMDPPEAYDTASSVGEVPYEDLETSLKELVDEHKEVTEQFKGFEKALIDFKESHFNFTRDVAETFNTFFKFFDEHVLPHNRKEERHLFPVLNRKLIESGEHSTGDNPRTAIDLMEDDHMKFIQLGTLTFNMLGLASRLPDEHSRAITFDLAYNSGVELVELMKLHIFKEDSTLFPLAHQLLTAEEFTAVQNEMSEFHA